MQILYSNKKLQKLVEDKYRMMKENGMEFAKLFYKRIDQLKAIKNVYLLMGSGLDNPHFLNGNLKNCIGWSVSANKRMILEVEKSGNDFESMKLEKITLRGVVDYHGDKENWVIA